MAIVSNKTLGLIGILCAPFLSLEMMQPPAPGSVNSSLGSCFDLLFMLGWMCSIWSFLRSEAAQTNSTITILLTVQLALLAVANAWNVWAIFDPTNKSTEFYALDKFWPLSNVFLLAVGIIMVVKKTFRGWQRYVVLLAGAWLPCTMVVGTIAGKSPITFWISGMHSVLGWVLMGWAAYRTPIAKIVSPNTRMAY